MTFHVQTGNLLQNLKQPIKDLWSNHPVSSLYNMGKDNFTPTMQKLSSGIMATNPATQIASSLANVATIPTTFVASLLGISPSAVTPAMEEEIKRQILRDVRETGKYTGGIQYEDLGFRSIWNDTGEHPLSQSSKAGVFSPQTALGLTGGKMDWAVDPTTGEISFPGGTDYNFPPSFGVGLSKYINKQNQEYNPSKSWSNLGQPLKIDPAILKREINIFNPAERNYQRTQQIMNPLDVIKDTSDYWRAEFKDIPYREIDPVINQPTTQPTITYNTPPPPAPTVPTYNPPQGPAGFTRPPPPSYAQQAKAVNTKARNMGVASPIRRTPGTKYGFGL